MMVENPVAGDLVLLNDEQLFFVTAMVVEKLLQVDETYSQSLNGKRARLENKPGSGHVVTIGKEEETVPLYKSDRVDLVVHDLHDLERRKFLTIIRD